MAVGYGARDVLRGDVRAGAGLVVHHHRLADFPRQLVGDDAREKIAAAPGRKSDHEPQRPVRVALSPCDRRRSEHQQNHGQGATRDERHGSLLQAFPPAAIRYHGTAYFECNLPARGPTGLMLANQLGRRGIRAMIVDRHSGPAQQTRAMAVHARTLEIYSKLGIAERALELGRRGNGANMWAEGKWTARIPLGDIGKSISPFPFVLMLGQDDNERIMGDHLRNWGLAVQWNTELTGITQEPGRVIATLKQPDGSTRKIQAAYVAGCDGGHSAVRELSGITFPGAPYEHVFFVADTEATGPMVAEELNVYLWRDGFHLFFPMRGKDRWRVIGILPKKLRGRDDVTFEELSPDIRREAGANLDFKECSWFSTYRIHHRAAEKFRDRRCFLLGDAAHVHSPMGGQGMNTGLQDAYNLAWKLALVVKGHADAAVLDTYEQERIPVAQR